MYYGEELGMEKTTPNGSKMCRTQSASAVGLKKKAATASARPCSGMPLSMRASAAKGPGILYDPRYPSTTLETERKTQIQFSITTSTCSRSGTPTRRCSMASTWPGTKTTQCSGLCAQL